MKYILWEIPIYSMKEKEFNKRWNNFFRKIDCNEESKQLIKDFFFPMTVWKYNQIIGYIVISISKYDVWFDCYLTLNKYYSKKRFVFNSKNKNFMHDIGLSHHFRVEKEDDNDKIIQELNNKLSELIEDELLKKYYVDINVFKKQSEYINVRQVMNEL